MGGRQAQLPIVLYIHHTLSSARVNDGLSGLRSVRRHDCPHFPQSLVGRRNWRAEIIVQTAVTHLIISRVSHQIKRDQEVIPRVSKTRLRQWGAWRGIRYFLWGLSFRCFRLVICAARKKVGWDNRWIRLRE